MSRSSPWMFSRFLTKQADELTVDLAFPFGLEPVAELGVVLG